MAKPLLEGLDAARRLLLFVWERDLRLLVRSWWRASSIVEIWQLLADHQLRARGRAEGTSVGSLLRGIPLGGYRYLLGSGLIGCPAVPSGGIGAVRSVTALRLNHRRKLRGAQSLGACVHHGPGEGNEKLGALCEFAHHRGEAQ
jgi:hypothetical protein